MASLSLASSLLASEDESTRVSTAKDLSNIRISSRNIGLTGSLSQPQQQIDDKTTTDMRPLAPAVLQDPGVRAACVFERVCQDGHPVKGAFVVARLGELADRAAVPGEPGGVEGDWVGGVAEYIAGQVRKHGR